MATKRAAPPAPKEVKDEKSSDEPRTRRSFGPRGWLAEQVDDYCRNVNDDDLPVKVNDIVTSIKNSDGENPSTGAVAACLTRWQEQGYVKLKTSRPLSFNGYTAKWKDKSFADFLEAQKAKRAKERAAKKADAEG